MFIVFMVFMYVHILCLKYYYESINKQSAMDPKWINLFTRPVDPNSKINSGFEFESKFLKNSNPNKLKKFEFRHLLKIRIFLSD